MLKSRALFSEKKVEVKKGRKWLIVFILSVNFSETFCVENMCKSCLARENKYRRKVFHVHNLEFYLAINSVAKVKLKVCRSSFILEENLSFIEIHGQFCKCAVNKINGGSF